jgi:hypothetical protein
MTTDRAALAASTSAKQGEREALEACRAACVRILDQYDGWPQCGIDFHALLKGIDRALTPSQPVEAEHEPNAKLLALADRIDPEKLWRWAGMDHHKMTPEQRDRMEAGVNLRRYADLLGNGGWRIFSPRPGLSFRASTLDKAIEMARREEARLTPPSVAPTLQNHEPKT